MSSFSLLGDLRRDSTLNNLPRLKETPLKFSRLASEQATASLYQ